MDKLELIKNNANLQEQTPFYLFDYDEINRRVSSINQLLSKNAKLCYAIKANPFLIPALQNQDLLFEVCSPGELSICEKYQLASSKIVFSGVCKTFEDIKRAYNLCVKTITLESELHCDYLLQVLDSTAKENQHPQEIILRLSSGNQFGMSEGDIKKCIEKLKAYPSLKIRGIHYFTGTQKKLNKIAEEISFICDFCDRLQKETSITFTDIEYGPGLSFNYFTTSDEANNFTELEQFSKLIENSNYNFVIELGRYVASSCGYYVTKIMDVKTNSTGNYCIIDGGINHINYYGQMMGMKLPPVEQIQSNPNAFEEKKYSICGSLCTTADVVLRELHLKDAQPGDLLIFKNIGAYSITEGIYLFLSHPLPKVFVSKGDLLKCVRNSIESYNINSMD
ncbi:MAG: alanine racemase [Treponema sp.]|nr:alanine racemase [Treponema sp.]